MSKVLKFATTLTLLVLFSSSVHAFTGGSTQQSNPTKMIPALTISGNVVNTLKAGGYSYVCVESDGRQQWAAMPPTEVAIGDAVEITPIMEMKNFQSRALGRTFDSVYFANGLVKK